MKRLKVIAVGLVLAVTMLAAPACSSLDKSEGSGYHIALSMSFTGNDWQAEARDLILATAKSPGFKDRVAGVDVYVSGTDAQAQISQIQQMIAQRYSAIIIYPVSSTALNNVIKQGCEAGIPMFTYDATVTEPCAHGVSFDQKKLGQVTAEYLADAMGNKGNVVLITGVPGNSVDTDRTSAAEAVFRARGINILDKCAGQWAQGPGGQCMSRFLAAFNDIDGVWSQAGGIAIPNAFDAVGRPYVPILTESENQWRLALGDPAMIAKGLTGASYGSPPYQGAAAFTMAVDALDGKTFPHFIDIGFEFVKQDQIKLCTTGSLTELREGCNTYPNDRVSSGFFASWWSEKWTPTIDLNTLQSTN